MVCLQTDHQRPDRRSRQIAGAIRLIGISEILGAIRITLPWWTGILPALTLLGISILVAWGLARQL